jgi:GT2 family glycosyltransferase
LFAKYFSHELAIIIEENPVNKQSEIAVVMLNWNGRDDSLSCLNALKKQTLNHQIVVVDNGSSDGLVEEIESNKDIQIIKNAKNLGFAGGVNVGISWAIDKGFKYVALINNDAIPENDWLEKLHEYLINNLGAGIATGKLLRTNGMIDSTGDLYTIWGLAYPRGRDEQDHGQYGQTELVFGASGGASLYRIDMLRNIGLFDEDFFAYFEDVDISFRAQLAGWNVGYVHDAIAHHKVSATTSKIPGFATYHTIKNLPWLLWKNVPFLLLIKIWPRFFVAHLSIVVSSLAKGKIWPTTKGVFMSFLLFPKKLLQRSSIQRSRKVSATDIQKILVNDLPPNANKLRALQSFFTKSKSN